MGCFTRGNRTQPQTNEKANSVPMPTVCPKSLIGINPAKILTKSIKKILVLKDIRNFVCTSPNIFGNNPSLLMVQKTQLCPRSITEI
jgi:hypothetical protein